MPAIESKHSQSGIAPVSIAYIGNKEIKKDTLCRTGVIWYGYLDVQAVDPVPASRLLKFSSIWIREEHLEKYKESIEAALTEDAAEEKEVAPEKADDSVLVEGGLADAKEDQVGTEKLEAIQTVIISLDQENPDHFTSKGKPKVEAVRSRMPDIEVSSEDVAAAFSELKGS